MNESSQMDQMGNVFTNAFISFFALYLLELFLTFSGALFHSLIASLTHVFCVMADLPTSTGLAFVHALLLVELKRK